MSLKDLIKQLPHPLFLRLFYFQYFFRERRLADAARRRAQLPLLTAEALYQAKRSEVLFILGGSPSINQIPESRWQVMAKHDTAALNFWPLHPFVPRMYFFESIEADVDRPRNEFLLGVLQARAADYQQTIKVATEIHRRGPQTIDAVPEAFRKNLYVAHSMPAPARNLRELCYTFDYLRARKFFHPHKNYSHLVKCVSSLSALLLLGARLGYRQVVLCGIDLRTQEYFFQEPSRFPKYAELEFLPRLQPHDTNTPLQWRLPAADVVQQIDRQFLQPEGINLYLENSNSALWPNIPLAPDWLWSS